MVNVVFKRVGINRPDLAWTLTGARFYVEVEGPSNPRGAAHQARIFANDPSAAIPGRITVVLIP
jgi:hypothetical protein